MTGDRPLVTSPNNHSVSPKMKLQALLSISTLFAFYASTLPAQNWQDLGYGTNGANGRVPQHTVVGGAVGKYIEFTVNAA